MRLHGVSVIEHRTPMITTMSQQAYSRRWLQIPTLIEVGKMSCSAPQDRSSLSGSDQRLIGIGNTEGTLKQVNVLPESFNRRHSNSALRKRPGLAERLAQSRTLFDGLELWIIGPGERRNGLYIDQPFRTTHHLSLLFQYRFKPRRNANSPVSHVPESSFLLRFP